MIKKVHLEREIAVAHQLKGYRGKCKNLHGHNLKITIDVATKDVVNPEYPNMVMDFRTLKEIVDFYDHSDLNEKLNTESPTAELLAESLLHQIEQYARQHFRYKVVILVRVQEAQGQWAEVEHEFIV